MIIAARGKMNVPKTIGPAWPTGLKEEKTANTMAMHEPPPSSAESNDTPNTSFGRITVVPGLRFGRKEISYGTQNAGKNTTPAKVRYALASC
jgi:hypothetical protein